MGFPVFADVGVEQLHDVFHSLCIQYAREVDTLLVVHHGKLCDTDVWEVLRTQT